MLWATIFRVRLDYSVRLHQRANAGAFFDNASVFDMKIHEYQGKEILREFGVPTPRGQACFSVDDAVAAAQGVGG